MGAGFVRAAYKRLLLRSDYFKRLRDRFSFYAGRIVSRTYKDKIVVHNLTAVHSGAFSHKLVLGRGIVSEHDIYIAVSAVFQGLTGAYGHPLKLYARIFKEDRGQIVEKPCVVCASGRRHFEHRRVRVRRGAEGQHQHRKQRHYDTCAFFKIHLYFPLFYNLNDTHTLLCKSYALYSTLFYSVWVNIKQ